MMLETVKLAIKLVVQNDAEKVGGMDNLEVA